MITQKNEKAGDTIIATSDYFKNSIIFPNVGGKNGGIDDITLFNVAGDHLYMRAGKQSGELGNIYEFNSTFSSLILLKIIDSM